MNNTPEMEKAIKETIEELKGLSPEEWRKLLNESEEKEPSIDSPEFLRQT